MFRARIENGKLAMSHQEAVRWNEWKLAHEGGKVIILPAKAQRSNQQNRYYWFYLGLIEKDTGSDVNDLHAFFKRELLPPVIRVVLGKEMAFPASTMELSKGEFGDYLEKIRALTHVPLPDPEAAGYISNYDKPYKK